MITLRRFALRLRLQRRHFASSTSGKTHFGYETVDENEKSRKVYDVFENVATRYDLMNDVMSFGVHRFWKDNFVNRLSPTANIRLLDMAGGTGDIAFRVLRYIDYKSRQSGIPSNFGANSSLSEANWSVPGGNVITGRDRNEGDQSTSSQMENNDKASVSRPITVCDINQAMLDVGKKRAMQLGVNEGVQWVQGDAEKLPFGDNQFDAYTIAFGIRNCTHIDKVLQEAYRVLKQGGRFMCLEFSQVWAPGLSSFYDWYSFQVIPVMGQVFASDWKSYQYLVESIRQFPNQEEFANMIRQAGFRCVTYENMSFGIVAIHSGFKL